DRDGQRHRRSARDQARRRPGHSQAGDVMANPLSLVTNLPSTADTVDLLVKIAGQQLDGATAAAVLDVSVQQRLGQPAHLTLRLAAWDPDTNQLTLVDDPKLAPGSSVE